MIPARRLAALLGLSAGAYALGVRPRVLRCGASDEEVRQPYPGAEIPGGRRGATMAVTILAGPLNYLGFNPMISCTAPKPSGA